MKKRFFSLMLIIFLEGLCCMNAQLSFAPATNYPVITQAESSDYSPSGPEPRHLVAADLFNNGKVDLIGAIFFATPDNSPLAVLTNNGSGVFGLAPKLAGGHNPVQLLSVDVNNDGRVDLVSVNTFGTLTVLTNSVGGAFGSNATYQVGAQLSAAVAADVNSDGKLDLICAGSIIPSSFLIVLTNNGDGIFGLSSQYLTDGYSAAIVAADINGDNKLDLITANDNTLMILTNNGGGVFGSNTIVTVGAHSFSIVATDVNGDGKMDLITGNEYANESGYYNAVTVFTNNGNGGFTPTSSADVGDKPLSIVAADVNGDGEPDLITANINDSSLTVLTNNGSGGFVLALTLGVGEGPFQVIAADINGDGKLDLVSVNDLDASLSVLINTSPFPAPTSTPILTIHSTANGLALSWPADSAGWSLQQSFDLGPSNWSPSGYSGFNIADDGMNKNLIVIPTTEKLFFRLMHP